MALLLDSRLRRGGHCDTEFCFDVSAPGSLAPLLGSLVTAGFGDAFVEVAESRLAEEIDVDRNEHQSGHDRQETQHHSSKSNSTVVGLAPLCSPSTHESHH